MADTLLLGNGVNRLMRDAPSWRNVIIDLAQFVDKKNAIAQHLDRKPFTLIFEEIFLRSARASGVSELELKKRAAELIDQIQFNQFHADFMRAGCRHVITTNYDYNFENSITNASIDTSLSPERKYSLFRRRTAEGVNVWHIHGESGAPNSLLLGHEHYSGTLQKMRAYLTSGRSRGKTNRSPFRAGNLDFDLEHDGVYSWADVFLRDDIHIAGYSLDFSEIDLWWLIIYKERLRLRGEPTGKTFAYQLMSRPRSIEGAKVALLSSFGVEVVNRYSSESYESSYDALIEGLKS